MRLLKELPKAIQEHINRRYHPKWLNPNKCIARLFSFSETVEGAEVWHEVNKGNYEPWCKFHFYDFIDIAEMSQHDKMIIKQREEKQIEDLELILKKLDGIYT